MKKRNLSYISLFLVTVMLLLSLAVVLSSCTVANTDGETENESFLPSETEPSATEGNVYYTVTVVDENNSPVSGARVQMCKGDLCFMPEFTDKDGNAIFELEEYNGYKAYVSKADGYIFSNEYSHFGINEKSLTIIVRSSDLPDVQQTEPSETQPTEPAETQPTESAETQPTESAETQPTEPAETQPTEPAETQPTEPAETQPTEPAETQPTEPAETQPTEPAETQPEEPSESAPFGSVIAVTDSNFDEEVLNYEGVVMVKFGATWCPPCQAMAPVLEEFAEENPYVKVVDVDVDSCPVTTAAYDIYSIPETIIFKNGQIHDRIVGVMTKDKMLELVTAAQNS